MGHPLPIQSRPGTGFRRFVLSAVGCAAVLLIGGCAQEKQKKPVEVREERTVTEAERRQLERERRTRQREAKDLATETMRSLWTRYQSERRPEEYDATLEKLAKQALVRSAFADALRQTQQALDNYERAYPTGPLESWQPLPGTFEEWVQEAARRKLEDRNDPVGAELATPAPLEIHDKRLLRLDLELLAATAELYAGRAAASHDRSRQVILATDNLLDETRKYEKLVLANLQMARALVELGQYQKGVRAAADAIEFAKRSRLANLVGELKQVQLDMAMTLGDYRTANALAAEIAQSAQARGDLHSQMSHLLVVARTEKLLGRWPKLAEIVGQIDALCVEAMNAYLAEAESALYRSYLAAEDGKQQDAHQALSLAVKRAALATGVDQADMLTTLADRWIEFAEPTKAAELYQAVIDGSHPAGTTCWALLGLGKTQLMSGSGADAAEPLARAAELFERSRLTFSVGSFRALWADRGAGIYETAIQQAFLTEQPGSALELMERSRARSFREQLRGEATGKPQTESQRRLTEIDAELASQRRLRQDVSVLVRGTATEALELDVNQIRAEMDEREQALLVERNQLLALEDPGGDQAISPDALPTIESRELTASVGEDAVALVYFLGREHSYVSLLAGGTVRTFELQATSDDVRKRVSDFRVAIATIGDEQLDYASPLKWLSQQLFDPVAEHLPAGVLLVVAPHGPMHYLPFGALRTPGGSYLIEEHPIVVLPALSVLEYCRENNQGNLDTILAVGNPALDSPELPNLPQAEQEARQLAELYADNAKLLTGSDAAEAAVTGLLKDYDIIHLSTHGRLEPQSPSNSALLLAADDRTDGRLTVREIRELELKANLVVLSACETGLGATEAGRLGSPGDDLVGLSRAFISAGAPAVLCSLWQVADESTSQTMLAFYEQLRAGRNKAEALRAAQLALMNRQVTLQLHDRETGVSREITVSGDHPFLWAPFVLFGDWN